MADIDEEFFETVLDAIDDLVLVKGPRSRLVWGNRAFRDLYGLTNESLRELIDGEQADPDDTLQYVRDDHRVFTSKARVDVPSEQVTAADGTTAFFHTIKNPITRGDDVVYQVGVSRIVVDERSIVESQTQRSLAVGSFAALRSLVQALPSAVAMFDASTRFVAWSQPFAELFHAHHTPDLLGALYRDVLEDRFPLLDDLDAAMSGNDVGRRIASIDTSRQRQRSIEVECRPWFDHTGQIGGSVAILYDVTDLLEDQALLRLANEELSQFTYRASHDLVAPVTTAQGLLDLAAESLTDDVDDAAHMIGLAQNQLADLNKLIGELMDLARADASSTVREEVDIATLLNSLTHLGELPSDQQPLDLSLDLEVASVFIEPVRLQQVLTNLLSNAMKFSDRSETVRTLHVHSRRDRGAVIIEIADNGVGIDADDASSIFEIFKRGRSRQRGHGLGLYIVSKHLRHLGGSIEVTSLRKPTTFTITLPEDVAFPCQTGDRG